MKPIQLFTDGSVDVSSGIGYGAYLVVENDYSLEEIKNQIHVRRFENTSSTRLELENLLWALQRIKSVNSKIEIYTDSQNIISLPGRRDRFEVNAYRSKNNRLLANHDLYKEFFRITETIKYELIKVEGHQPSERKNDIARLFTLVDRASRIALRREFNQKT